MASKRKLHGMYGRITTRGEVILDLLFFSFVTSKSQEIHTPGCFWLLAE